MILNFSFFFNSILFGIGLAMDAFSVSIANALNEPAMKKRKMFGIAGMFAFFQALMPMIGWECIHTIVCWFSFLEKIIPWIALILLCYIGGKMMYEGITQKGEEEKIGVGFAGLIVQGIATSIDALSVGLTIADYGFFPALICAFIIATVTFVICMGGLAIGKKAGTVLTHRSGMLGGAILIFIGIEIFIKGLF